MELDDFCTSGITDSYPNCDIYNLLEGSGIYITPKDTKLKKYYINISNWGIVDFINETSRTKLIARICENGVEINSLVDVLELFNISDFTKQDSYVTLHNYCCRRLREEIELQTGITLTRPAKYKNNSAVDL
jgi:hypothetical protein